jgi:hypothetical protein
MASAPIDQFKACIKCGQTKPLTEFGKRTASPGGKHPLCKACVCKRSLDWHHNNRDVSNARARKWKAANRDKVSAYNKLYAETDTRKSERFAEWAAQNKQRRRAYMVEWNKANPQKVGEYNRRRAESPMFRINNAFRCRIWSSLNGAKPGRTFALLGYTLEELARHIERQFTSGMNWGNYGDWHIDHIIPLSSFTYTTTEDPDFRAAWALTNLRPLWAVQNITKGAKRLTLL